MWAKNFASCVDCGTTEFKHMAKGLCSSCYARKYRKSNSKRLKRHKRAWYIMNRDLSQMKKERDKKHFDGKREKALKRDNYTCCECGSKDRSSLLVHHKDKTTARQGDKANNHMRNLITLCRKCHVRLHKKDLLQARMIRKNSKWGNRWSRKYDSCVECGTADRRYGARGLCTNCYARFLKKR